MKNQCKELLSNSLPERNVSWKLKVPLKIKIFLWYLKKGVILTRDNLAKINWKEDNTGFLHSLANNPLRKSQNVL